MGEQVIQGFGGGKHLMRREQQQSVKFAWEGDGLRWADSNTNVVPFLLLNPFRR